MMYLYFIMFKISVGHLVLFYLDLNCHFHTGSVILLEDGGVSEMGLSKNRMFQTVLVPDPVYISTVNPHDMFGYAVTSGRFLSKDKILYAGGAPGGADFYGKASILLFFLM